MRKTTPDRALKIAGWFAAFVLPVLMSSQVPAQSGRRAPRTSPPIPSENNTPEDHNKALPRAELAHQLELLIARQPSSKHFAAEDSIYAAFIERLSQYPSITTKPLGDLKHNQAVKQAKKQNDSLVVFVRFDIDSFQEGTILLNSHDLIVEYMVLAPRTGKQRSKGKVYYQSVGGGRLRKSEWPNGTPIRITTEAAGVEAAEQLYAWLAIVVGVKHSQ